MKVNLLIIILAIVGCSNQKTTKPVETKKELITNHSKYRQECALISKKFKKSLPSGFVSVWCADDKREDLGKVEADIIHAMTVAAFYEKRMDRRFSAMNLIEKYNCTNKIDCKEFHRLLDWGIKSGHPNRYSKELAERASNLRKQVSKKLKTFQK